MKKYLTEHKLYWPVSPELMASYRDGSHTEEWAHGTLIWKKNSVFHRDRDKPALIRVDRKLAWYKNGKCHRDGDMPAWIYADGSLLWYKNGLRHRTTGPAVINQNNKKEYWINDVDITKEVNAWLKTRKYKGPFTPEQQVEFSLTFS
jgi:hypothetical protein